jgi:hypothetical protein
VEAGIFRIPAASFGGPSSLLYAEVLALDRGSLLVAFSLSILHWWKHATDNTAIMSLIVFGCKWAIKACF